MRSLKKTIFISDIHLEKYCSISTQSFLLLLQQLKPQTIDSLYILGDLFESWIGDDDNSSFNQTVIEALRKVSQRNIPVYFIAGNRDFLVGSEFMQGSGCKPLGDIEMISLYGESVVIMHGDLLCTQDKRYLRARKVLRNKLLQKIYLRFPLSLRANLARRIRDKSKQYTSRAPADIMDVTPNEVAKVLQKYQSRFLIHGHTHRPYVHDIPEANNAQRIVLGAWHQHGNLLVWNENGDKTLINFTQQDDLQFLDM